MWFTCCGGAGSGGNSDLKGASFGAAAWARLDSVVPLVDGASGCVETSGLGGAWTAQRTAATMLRLSGIEQSATRGSQVQMANHLVAGKLRMKDTAAAASMTGRYLQYK